MTLPGSVLLDVIQNLSLHLPNLRRAMRALLSRSEVVRNGSSDRTLQLMRDACSERQPGKRKARPTLTLLGALFENYNATSKQVMKVQPPPEPWDAIDGAFTEPFTPMLLVSFQALLAPPDDAEFEPLDEGGQCAS